MGKRDNRVVSNARGRQRGPGCRPPPDSAAVPGRPQRCGGRAEAAEGPTGRVQGSGRREREAESRWPGERGRRPSVRSGGPAAAGWEAPSS